MGKLSSIRGSLTVLSMSAMAMPIQTYAQDATQGDNSLDPVEFLELPRVASVSASHDGRYLSYVLSAPDWAEDETVETLRILRCGDDGCARTALNNLPESPETEAIWRPRSHQFVVVAEVEEEGGDQIHFFDPETGEASQVTNHPGGVRQVSWLPDGSALIYESDAEAEDDAANEWSIEPFGSADADALYRVDMTSGETSVVFASAGLIEGYSLSENGRYLIVRQRFDPVAEDRDAAELWRIDLRSGESRQLTDNRIRENGARLAPDGETFAYIASVNAGGEPYYEDNLFVQAVGEEAPRLLFPHEPLEVQDFEWDRSGESMWVVGNSGLRSQLYRVRVRDGALTQVTFGDHSLSDWTYDSESGRHFGRFANEHSPGEIHEIDPRTGVLRQRSAIYSTALSGVTLPKQRAFTWSAADGQKLEGLLVYPVGYQTGQRYPLVTITHGGPRSSAQFGSWNASRYVPVLAGQGYAVFLPNHRGGTGYGDAFMRAMVGNYFRNAHTDVLSGVDALVANEIADADRLIKMGWSAGGHMTNRLITMTHRFVAASSGAGVADWVSLFGESDRRSGRIPWFGGTPWQENAPLPSYRSQSPVFDAWKVRTPTLFWSGGDDERVPPTQAILMFRAVRDTGTPTALYLGKGEPHNFRQPSHKLFKINRELAWYAEHLGRDAYEADLPAIDPRTEDSGSDGTAP